MENKCRGCGIVLQTKNEKEIGYVKSLEMSLCMRCFKMKHHNLVPDTMLDNEVFINLLREIGNSNNLVLWLVDLFDFEGTYLKEVETYIKTNPIILVGNKLDLLPKAVSNNKIKKWLIDSVDLDVNIKDVILMSGLKKFQIDKVMELIREFATKKVYVIGNTNTGKSTFINNLTRSLGKENELEITTSYYAGTTLGQIEIKLNKNITIIDTPGILNESQMTNLVEPDSLKIIVPKNEIRPVNYQLNSGQTLFLTGLVQFDFIKGNPTSYTIYISNQINIHRTKIENSQELREKHLSKTLLSPPNEKELLKIDSFKDVKLKITNSKTDIVISGLGWITVNSITSDIEVILTVPTTIDITLRDSII